MVKKYNILLILAAKTREGRRIHSPAASRKNRMPGVQNHITVIRHHTSDSLPLDIPNPPPKSDRNPAGCSRHPISHKVRCEIRANASMRSVPPFPVLLPKTAIGFGSVSAYAGHSCFGCAKPLRGRPTRLPDLGGGFGQTCPLEKRTKIHYNN